MKSRISKTRPLHYYYYYYHLHLPTKLSAIASARSSSSWFTGGVALLWVWEEEGGGGGEGIYGISDNSWSASQVGRTPVTTNMEYPIQNKERIINRIKWRAVITLTAIKILANSLIGSFESWQIPKQIVPLCYTYKIIMHFAKFLLIYLLLWVELKIN